MEYKATLYAEMREAKNGERIPVGFIAKIEGLEIEFGTKTSTDLEPMFCFNIKESINLTQELIIMVNNTWTQIDTNRDCLDYHSAVLFYHQYVQELDIQAYNWPIFFDLLVWWFIFEYKNAPMYPKNVAT